MIRQPEHEHLKRLTVKTFDQVIVMRAKECLWGPLFEAQALTDLVKNSDAGSTKAASFEVRSKPSWTSTRMVTKSLDSDIFLLAPAWDRCL